MSDGEKKEKKLSTRFPNIQIYGEEAMAMNGKQKRSVKTPGLNERRQFARSKFQPAGDALPDVFKQVKRGCVTRWVAIEPAKATA